MRALQTISIGAMCVWLAAGCTTLQPLETDSGEAQDPQQLAMLIQPDDHVEIITTDSVLHDLRVVSVSEVGVAGRPWVTGESAGRGATVVIPLDEIASISRYEVDGRRVAVNTAKGVGIVVAGAVVLAVVGAVLLIALLGGG
jgi:hypothetical protein